jgi:predicted NBD/HSP70 family sugar kinase
MAERSDVAEGGTVVAQDDRTDRDTRTVPGTPAWLRARNDRTALELLLTHGDLTRNQLGELTGLSKPTASQMVQRLEAARLVTASGSQSGGPGPNASTYAVRKDAAVGVAVDFDARRMRACVVDATGTEHPAVEVTLPRSRRTPEGDVRQAVDAAAIAAGIDPALIGSVCIGVPGAVDPRTGDLRFADALTGWPTRDVAVRLRDALGLAVTIENDVNLAAIAERTAGVGRGTGGFALLWLGQGLGLAVDQAGTLQRGASGGAGEIGYLPVPRTAMTLDPDARELQDLIGGIQVTALTREAGASCRTYRDAIAALTRDAAVRARVTERLAPRVAAGLVAVLAILDPERIVLGGATGAALGPGLAAAVAVQLKAGTAWDPDIAATGVLTAPVLAGAREHLAAALQASLFERLDRVTP